MAGDCQEIRDGGSIVIARVKDDGLAVLPLRKTPNQRRRVAVEVDVPGVVDRSRNPHRAVEWRHQAQQRDVAGVAAAGVRGENRPRGNRKGRCRHRDTARLDRQIRGERIQAAVQLVVVAKAEPDAEHDAKCRGVPERAP